MSFEKQEKQSMSESVESDERFNGDHWVLENGLSLGEVVGDALKDRLLERGWSESEIGNFPVVVQEAVNNAVIHGNWGIQKKNYPTVDGYQAAILERERANDDDEKKVTVDIQISESGEDVDVTVLDEGPGFSPDDIPDPTSGENITKTSGRGWFLMTQLARPELTEGKGRVVLHWNKNSESDGYHSIKESPRHEV